MTTALRLCWSKTPAAQATGHVPLVPPLRTRKPTHTRLSPSPSAPTIGCHPWPPRHPHEIAHINKYKQIPKKKVQNFKELRFIIQKNTVLHSRFGCCQESRGSRVAISCCGPAPHIFERYKCPIVILRDNERVHRGTPVCPSRGSTGPSGLHLPDCRHGYTPSTSATIQGGGRSCARKHHSPHAKKQPLAL